MAECRQLGQGLMSERRASVVIFSPVRLAARVLRETLVELGALQQETVALAYWFYDDNVDPESSRLLREFCRQRHGNARILPGLELGSAIPDRNGSEHVWIRPLIDRVAAIKNLALAEFLKTPAEAIFLVDADIALPSNIIDHLYSLDLDIVSEVFWTRWLPWKPYLPNVWDRQVYSFHSGKSLLRLRSAGQHRVAGLGACTLVRRRPIEQGVSFSRIEGLDLWGEDRHFCVRAACLGFDLYADTVCPPFHVYRESQLAELEAWRRARHAPDFFASWLTCEWEADVVDYIRTQNQSPVSALARLRGLLGSSIAKVYPRLPPMFQRAFDRAGRVMAG